VALGRFQRSGATCRIIVCLIGPSRIGGLANRGCDRDGDRDKERPVPHREATEQSGDLPAARTMRRVRAVGAVGTVRTVGAVLPDNGVRPRTMENECLIGALRRCGADA
jgi:hypothetical protein